MILDSRAVITIECSIMDTKDAGSKGGKTAWKGKSKKEKSQIMSERQKKRWARVHAEQEATNAEPKATKQA